MSANDRSLRPANRAMLRSVLPHRQPAPLYETVVVEPDARDQECLVTLVLALAPMAFAFFYLALVALMIF